MGIINRIGGSGINLAALRAAMKALGPTLLLDADLISGNDGNAIQTWSDDSGNSRNFSQATSGCRPLLKKAANGINSHNVLRFDGTDDWMASAVAISTMVSASAHTAFFVYRLLSVATNDTLIGMNDALLDSGLYMGYVFRTNGNAYAHIYYSNSYPAAAQAISTNTPYIAQSRHASGTLYHSINGGSDSSVSAGNIENLYYPFYLAYSPVMALYSNIDIAEVILFNTALSESNRAIVAAYLKAKYATY